MWFVSFQKWNLHAMWYEIHFIFFFIRNSQDIARFLIQFVDAFFVVHEPLIKAFVCWELLSVIIIAQRMNERETKHFMKWEVKYLHNNLHEVNDGLSLLMKALNKRLRRRINKRQIFMMLSLWWMNEKERDRECMRICRASMHAWNQPQMTQNKLQTFGLNEWRDDWRWRKYFHNKNI